MQKQKRARARGQCTCGRTVSQWRQRKREKERPPPIDHFLTVMEDREGEAESPTAKRRNGREDYD